MPRVSLLVLALCLPVLSACIPAGGFDLRGGGIPSPAPTAETAPRPEPDANGLITYPNYQVVVARRGDTLSEVAARIGIDPGELARFNGRTVEDPLRDGEVLALPRRVTPAAPGGSGTDITQIASDAIDRADATAPSISTSTLEVQSGDEPVRHRVARGETAYSVARLYGVSVRSLADWNGLDADLTVREGQFLIIPLVLEEASNAPDAGEPGSSVTPLPPSASEPLPEVIETAELPETPDLEAETPSAEPEPSQQAAASGPQMQWPLSGDLLRGYSSSNEGIDIAGSQGASVRAADAGEVAAITQDTDQVPILVIRHAGNLLTVYANIENIRVSRGDRVSRGQVIADLGAGDPAALHFEVRRGFESVDPTPFLQ